MDIFHQFIVGISSIWHLTTLLIVVLIDTVKDCLSNLFKSYIFVFKSSPLFKSSDKLKLKDSSSYIVDKSYL